MCTACPAVGSLDLKMVLHRGQVVSQSIGTRMEILGPAVNVAHRLLKNSIQARLGYRPYLFVSDAAANGLNLAEPGFEHREEYADVGSVHGRVVTLGAAIGWVPQVAIARTSEAFRVFEGRKHQVLGARPRAGSTSPSPHR